MTTTASTRSRQLRLPGQADAHEGPVDLTNMYLAHHGFRRDLAAFARAVPLTPVEDRDAWKALVERWDMFSEVLHHHHNAEDDWLWPVLLERSDAAGRETLHAMKAEHAEIDPTLAACAAGFHRLSAHADPDARAALSVRLSAARESLGRHLAHEEQDAILLVQNVMGEEDWAAFEKRIQGTIRFSQVLRLVPWAIHGLPPEARRKVFATTGPAHRILWRLTRRRFERLDRLAFRHLPS